MNKKTITIIFTVIAIIIAVVGGVYFISKQKKEKEEAIGKFDTGFDFNIGVDVSGIGRGTEDALKNMPITNPIERVANPFRDAYKNPFE